MKILKKLFAILFLVISIIFTFSSCSDIESSENSFSEETYMEDTEDARYSFGKTSHIGNGHKTGGKR